MKQTTPNETVSKTAGRSVFARTYRTLAAAGLLMMIGSLPGFGMDVTDYVSRWELNGDATDSTGTNDGTLVGSPSFVTGQFDQAVDLDGSSQYVNIDGVADDVSGDFSYSVWFKSPSRTNQQCIFGINSSSGNKLMLMFRNGNLDLYDQAEGGWQGPFALQVDDDNWHNVIFTLSGNTATLYVDAYEVFSYTTSMSLSSTDRWSLGQEWDGSESDHLTGAIDDARVYNRALSADEVDDIVLQSMMAHANNPDKMAEHMKILELFPRSAVTDLAVQSGSWFDSNTWQDGTVPAAGERVGIPSGVEVDYDGAGASSLDWVRVDGKIDFATDTDTSMLVESLFISPMGTVHIGTTGNRVNSGVTAEIVIDTTGGAIDQNADPFALSRAFITHGETRIFGQVKTAHTTLDGDALANASKIVLSDSAIPTGWEVGDILVLAGTEVDTSLLNVGNKDQEIIDGDAANSRFKDELLEITGLSVNGGNVEVTFNNVTNQSAIDANRTTLLWDHQRPDGATFNPDELSIHVANLTRNIVVRSSDPTVDIQERAHFMVMHNPDAQIEYAQFKDLGRTDKRLLIDDPAALGNFDDTVTANGTNPRGRYSLHLHRVGTDGTKAIVTGNVVWGNPGWGIVHHDSHADLTENVVFDVVGAGIVSEDGNETGKWTRNLVIKATGDLVNNFDDNHFLGTGRTAMFDFGFNGSGYWVQGGGVRLVLEDNVAASINGAGIDIFNTMDGDPKKLKLPVEEIADADLRQALIDDGYTEVTMNNLPMESHTGTQVYNAYRGMFNWLHMRNSLNGKEGGFTFGTGVGHEYRSAVSDFKLWNVLTGLQNFYSTRIDYSNGLIVGNVDNPVPFDGSSQANNTEGVGLTHNRNNANYHTFDSIRVEGFDYGMSTFIPGGPNGMLTPYAVSRLTNSQFANVNYALVPSANSSQAFSDLFEMDEATTFSTLTSGSNNPPSATYSHSSVGGFGVDFDAGGSSDSEVPADVFETGDDGIAVYAWDLDNDGSHDDAYGEQIRHVFPGAGNYTVSLKVWDSNGETDTYSTSVSVSADAYPNPLANADFSGNLPEEINWYGAFKSSDRGIGWLMGEEQFAISNGALIADPNYTRPGQGGGVAQVLRDQYVRKGTQTLSIDLANTETDATTNKVYVRVHGVDGRFSSSLRRDDPTEQIEQYPFSGTLLFSEEFGGSTFSSTTFTRDIDFGSTGYEYIVVHVLYNDLDASAGDELEIDNVSLTGDAPAGGDTTPDITTSTLADATAGSAYSQSLSVTGGNAPLTWSLGSGAPAWLEIDPATGDLSGVPATSDEGTVNFDVTVTDNDSDSDTANFDLTVNFTPATNPNLTVSVYDGANALSPADGWVNSGELAVGYQNPVILATIAQAAGQPPVVPMIRKVSGASDEFEIKLIQPADAGSPDADADYDVTIVVVEAGSHSDWEAGTFTSTRTDHNGSWIGEQVSFANTYTQPVVFGQVMLEPGADPDWSVFWSARDNGGSVDRNNPADGNSAFIGKHVGEDNDTTRPNATLGYLVVEAGALTIEGNDAYAAQTTDSVREIDQSGGAVVLDLSAGGFTSISSALAGTNEMDGSDGGWAILAKPDAILGTDVAVAFQEDDMNDTDNRHTSEIVGVLAFGSVSLPETYGNGGTPGSGDAWAVAAGGANRIEAENFNQGGAGEAYSDTSSGNNGGSYRTTDVDIQGTSDTGGGYNVGWISQGEWMEYTIDVAEAGNYTFRARVASANSNPGDVKFSIGGVDLGTIAVDNADTNGWQDWLSKTLSGISLSEGPQVLRVEFVNSGSVNLNWFEIEKE